MELCLALTASATAFRVIMSVKFLPPLVSKPVLAMLSLEIIKASSSGSRSSHGNNSLMGVEYLLKSDFLSDSEATYKVADSIATSEDDGFSPELKSYLSENWSEQAYRNGVRNGEDHFVNLMRILERGGGAKVGLRDLPRELVVSVAYLGLYRECVTNGGPLLNQRLRGELVEAVRRLSGRVVDRSWESKELLGILEHYLPSFLI